MPYVLQETFCVCFEVYFCVVEPVFKNKIYDPQVKCQRRMYRCLGLRAIKEKQKIKNYTNYVLFHYFACHN